MPVGGGVIVLCLFFVWVCVCHHRWALGAFIVCIVGVVHVVGVVHIVGVVRVVVVMGIVVGSDVQGFENP